MCNLLAFLKSFLTSHEFTLFIIMLLTGLFGASFNFSRSHVPQNLRDKDNKYPSWKWTFSKYALAGVAASFMVPLFLKMISSDLIVKAQGDSTQWFVFTGFCLIAAISSNRFIETLTDQVLKQVNEAKEKAGEAKELARENQAEITETKSTLNAVIESDAEPSSLQPEETEDSIEDVSSYESDNAPSGSTTEETENIDPHRFQFKGSHIVDTDTGRFYSSITMKILEILNDSTRFKFRRPGSVNQQLTGVSALVFKRHIQVLKDTNLINVIINPDGQQLLSITPKGRTLIESFKEDQKITAGK